MLKSFSNLIVLELGHIYNGPYCGLLFAHLGAEVIKVEPLGGERLRTRARGDADPQEFVMLNSNKKSIALDLKSDDGKETFLKLVDRADVLIENYAPNTLERLGLALESLLERNPRLVIASGKGYGTSGPYSKMPAMDLTVQAMSGAIGTTGFADGPPVKTGPAFTDFSGGIHLFGGAMAALFDRTLTGAGQIVEVSMHDTIYPMLTSALSALYNQPGDQLPERTGNQHSGLAIAPYNVYRAADGWLAIICASDHHWTRLAKALGFAEAIEEPRFADPVSRAEHMEEIDALVTGATSKLTRAEISDLLGSAGVPFSPVKTLREVDQDPHLIEREMIRFVDHPENGRVPVVGNPLKMSTQQPGAALSVAPKVGQDQAEVLGRLLGMNEREAGALRTVPLGL
ncbi:MULTISPECIES: CaiB/BaiF CoA-transferase family protein [unclassified Arthrobacter]|uniref:CaiB/BaiF CoA transferase family protein n=1 Tax=unclassified Arthrobacter TaxID=235627 RepID=UPI001C6146DB|nr:MULTISPECIES: CoA transferase [unclassified Arthrobacter]